MRLYLRPNIKTQISEYFSISGRDLNYSPTFVTFSDRVDMYWDFRRHIRRFAKLWNLLRWYFSNLSNLFKNYHSERRQKKERRCKHTGQQFMISKTNKTKIGLNTMANRLSILNGRIPLSWLNATLSTYKIKCKKLFLDS